MTNAYTGLPHTRGLDSGLIKLQRSFRSRKLTFKAKSGAANLNLDELQNIVATCDFNSLMKNINT